MAKAFKTYEEAVDAQKEAALDLKEAKTALTDYYKKNKLKRDEDYTDDAKHGTKVARLQKEVDKKETTLEAIQEQLEALTPKGKKKPSAAAAVREEEAKGKPKKEKKASEPRNTKYEYPENCVTPDEKKKYRIKMRNAAKGKEEKPGKEEKKAKPGKEEAPKAETKKAAKGKKAEAPAEAPTKGKKKVVVKKNRKDDDD